MKKADLQKQELAVALWYDNLRQTNNETFLPLFFEDSRYLVLMGGGGSGKSIFAGRKLLERAVCEPGHRILVLRKVAKTLRESCFSQLLGQIREHYGNYNWKVSRTEPRIEAENGSQILFAGMDDTEKLKSIYRITMIWVEEASEMEEDDFNQLDIRLRGESQYEKQIILTFNPISANHWLKRRFFDDPPKNAFVHRSTYRDNRFLDEAAKQVLLSYRDTNPYYYAVYCLGQWGVSGKTVFDAQKVQARLSQVGTPLRQGYFDCSLQNGKLVKSWFVPETDGYVRIYREPEAGEAYVLGGDTAGRGTDYFAAQVLNARTGEQTAVLHHRFDEDLFARQVVSLARYYNEALVGVESNYSTYPIREIERLGYRNQYIREASDTFTGRMIRAYGFRTTAVTRPVILGELVRVVRESPHLFYDRQTLEEMLTFVRSENGRPEAQQGAHDDLVMSLAIALYIRGQAALPPPEESPPPRPNFACEREDGGEDRIVVI